jgi:hypothetical protein
MDVLFISTVAVVTADPPRSRQLSIDTLGLPQASIEFEVKDADAVAAAGQELQAG